MNVDLAPLLEVSNQWTLAALLVFARIGAISALLPAFGERTIPTRIRLAIAVSFTMIVLPAAGPMQVAHPLATLGIEAAIGLFFGMILRLTVFALQIAGQVAANATSLSQVFGGAAADPQPAIANLLFFAGLALAALADLHVFAAGMMIATYDVFPPGVPPSGDFLLQLALFRLTDSFGIALALAMPFLAVSLLYNVALGIINRAMPQLMVAFVGAPAITAGALALLFLCGPLMLTVWRNWMIGVVQNPLAGLP